MKRVLKEVPEMLVTKASRLFLSELIAFKAKNGLFYKLGVLSEDVCMHLHWTCVSNCEVFRNHVGTPLTPFDSIEEAVNYVIDNDLADNNGVLVFDHTGDFADYLSKNWKSK